MTSRLKKTGYGAVAALGVFVGAAGIAAATTGDTTGPAPTGEVDEVDDVDDDGVNCEDGIDSATGAECDGGPAAAQAEEASEVRDEAEDGDEADDGVDHEFEGEEIGENGDGIPGPDEASEADEQNG